MTVHVEVLYVPTCANSLTWLGKIREAVSGFGSDVILAEIDISEHPEVLKRYLSPVWQDFVYGYIHYVIIVVVNGKALEDWYWDTEKIVKAVRRELGLTRT